MAHWAFLLLMNSRTNFHPPHFLDQENAMSKMKFIYHVEASTVT